LSADPVILVVGGGLIGAGWAATFAGGGRPTVVVDPDPSAAAMIETTWLKAVPVLAALEQLAENPTPPVVVRTVGKVRQPISFVQEALPENLKLKRSVLASIEPLLAVDTPIASSSSSLMAAEIQAGLKHPERLLVAHPCNPPYLMPTVELSGSALTSVEALSRAEMLFSALGKVVLRLERECRGHLVNRLQFALWREAIHLIATGVANVADVERAVSVGLAPRWTAIGPTTVFHLAGGDHGIGKFFNDLGRDVEACWADLGAPNLDEATCRRVTVGMSVAAQGRNVAALAAERDTRMIALARFLATQRKDGSVSVKGRGT
jgi:carnitine 3-dehydrogenase